MEKHAVNVARSSTSRMCTEKHQKQTDKGHKEADQLCNTITDEESWQNSNGEMDKHIDVITIKSLSFNNIRLSIITKFITSSKEKKIKI